MKYVVLITGASSGMGKDFALHLIKLGCTVYGAARRVEKMKDLETAGGHVLEMDVTNDQMIVEGVDRIIAERGRIDVLINNAGYGSYGAIEDVPIEEARRQFEVNVFGLARITQLVLPHMRKQRFGRIINIGSIGGKIYTPLGGWYHATKHALEGFTDCLRFETEPFGIDVVLIEPGGIETEWGDIALESAKECSGNTAYADLVAGFTRLYERVGKQAPPSVITDLVIQAIQAKQPKTRYSAGTLAHTTPFLRRILSDRTYDRILRMIINRAEQK